MDKQSICILCQENMVVSACSNCGAPVCIECFDKTTNLCTACKRKTIE